LEKYAVALDMGLAHLIQRILMQKPQQIKMVKKMALEEGEELVLK